MIDLDAPTAVQRWFSERELQWRPLLMKATLRLPEGPGLNKAVATFETDTHVGSVTVWGAGTLEFIVLELATNHEVIMDDKEFRTAAELQTLLDDCADVFAGLARPK